MWRLFTGRGASSEPWLNTPFDQQSSDPRTSGTFSWALRPSQRGRGDSQSSLVLGKAREPLPPTAGREHGADPLKPAPVLSSTPRGSKDAGASRWRLPTSCSSRFSSLKRSTARPTPFPCKGHCEGGTGSLCPEGRPCSLPECFIDKHFYEPLK